MTESEIRRELRQCIKGKDKPNMVIKIRTGGDDDGQFQEIGKAWFNRKTGAILAELYGTQVISGDIYLFECPYYY